MPNETEHEKKKTPLYLLKAWLRTHSSSQIGACFSVSIHDSSVASAPLEGKAERLKRPPTMEGGVATASCAPILPKTVPAFCVWTRAWGNFSSVLPCSTSTRTPPTLDAPAPLGDKGHHTKTSLSQTTQTLCACSPKTVAGNRSGPPSPRCSSCRPLQDRRVTRSSSSLAPSSTETQHVLGSFLTV